MKKLLFTIALASIGASVSAQNINGTWSGELNAGFQKIKVVLNLSDDGKCTLDSPDQGAFGQEHLSLLALPMEIDTNGDIVQRER